MYSLQRGITMKYARLTNTTTVAYNSVTGMINMGDSIQTFAVNNLFRYAKIKPDNIIDIPLYGKATTNEPCYLVVQGHFGRQYDLDFMDNPNIHPIFIGFAFKDSFLLDDEIKYFKKYEPILCRDEFTKNVLKRYDVDAYISGCLTETFEKREENNTDPRNKYYFIDVPPKFIEMIPMHIKKNAIFTSQNIPIDTISDSIMENGAIKASERMNEYKKNAKMVITSKLHCMVPCVAMGIPTIAVGNNLSYRYSFADTFIDLYNEKQFKEYDWKIPKEKKDIETVKKLLLDVGKTMLEQCPDINKIKKLDNLYTNRCRWEYCHGIKNQLKKIFKTNNPKYILWGASSGGYAVNECIKELWPDSELVGIVDSFSSGIFSGKEIQKPQDVILNHPETVVIISTLSGCKSAELYLNEIGKIKNNNYFIVHENLSD